MSFIKINKERLGAVVRFIGYSAWLVALIVALVGLITLGGYIRYACAVILVAVNIAGVVDCAKDIYSDIKTIIGK